MASTVFLCKGFLVLPEGYQNTDKSQDIILKNALAAAKENGRAIAVMYDLSGLKAEGEDCSSVIEDWKMLVDKLKSNQSGRKSDLSYITTGNRWLQSGVLVSPTAHTI
jgi:hypothetical protein